MLNLSSIVQIYFIQSYNPVFYYPPDFCIISSSIIFTKYLVVGNTYQIEVIIKMTNLFLYFQNIII